MIRASLATLVLAPVASPALAEACRSAPELERQLAQATTAPFLAEIKPETPAPGRTIGASGGFEVPAQGLGQVDRLNGAMGEALTTCGHRLTFRTHWGGRGVESAGQFKVTSEAAPRLGRA